VIVSATLARTLFGTTRAAGRPVRLASTADRIHTIVGVAGDVPGAAIDDGPSRAIYLPNVHTGPADVAGGPAYVPRDERYIVRTGVAPAYAVAAIRETVRALDPKLVVTSVTTLEDLVSDSLAKPRLVMMLLLTGATTALLLGTIGIYGLLSYTVRRRSAELGVRIALGASPASMARMIVRQSAALALAGIGAGLIAAVALTRFLRALLYEVSPLDPVAFAAVAALTFSVALLAGWLPARRAARIDPVRTLKAD
jgi:predicted lysophospholipase L1 biosynthesis ABC-type transport system permease subunit